MAQAVKVSETLISQLGTSRTAGSWMGDDGRPVVAVTDKDAAAEVRQAGAQPKVVRYSLRQLRSATKHLSAAPRVSGTAWAVDYGSNKVVVHADSTVSAAEWSRISDVAERIGGSVEMKRTKGTFTTRLNGAAAMFAPNGRCSAGFNVTAGKENFILTAGHCGPIGTTWFGDSQGTRPVGNTVARSFPGNDFSLVRYESGESPEGVGVVEIGNDQGIRIIGAADPVVGQQVFRSGSSTGFHSGEVTALNATVNYPEGTVTGLIETTVCAEPGDSGGPLFAEGLALGVTSGGNGDCSAGGTTFFQPATQALTALGVTLTDTSSGDGNKDAGGTAPAGPKAPAAVPPAAARGGAPAAPGAPGAADGSVRLTELVSLRALTPGLAVIATSLLLLVAAHWIRERQERNRYRSDYSAGWG
jgi:hypothetical protein